MRNRSRYTTKYPIDMASVVIVVFWLMIWMLWFSVDDAYMYSDDYAPCEVTFLDVNAGDMSGYNNPEPFPRIPLNILEDNVDVDDGAPVRIVSRSKLLTRMKGEKLEAGYNQEFDSLRRAESAKYDYHPKWSNSLQRVNLPSTAAKTILMEPSIALRKFGYYIPGFAQEGLMKRNVSWEVTAHVEMNRHGQTEHVFLLSSCEDKGISSEVERMLYQGALFVTGQQCSGEVVVSFRGEK